jgi:uridine phosphorylase
VGGPKEHQPAPRQDDLEPHVTPQAWLKYFVGCAGRTLADIAVKRIVVGAWIPSAHSRLLTISQAESPPFQIRGERHGRYRDRELTLLSMPLGAPIAATAMEELIPRGADTFIFVGAAGSLQPHLPIGSVVIPTDCIVDEGTSRHYLPSGAAPRPSERLTALLAEACRERGIPFQQGLHWTTDAPYRELRGDIRRYAERGVLSVDMELSALFAVAMHRGVEAAGIVVVSDELFGPWNLAFFSPQFQEAEGSVCEAALDAASRA